MTTHRWTWPEGARALTAWLTSTELIALTGTTAATRGKIAGRIIDYRDLQNARHLACVERRKSEDGESGKYRYRLLDLRSLTPHYDAFELEPYTFTEHSVGLIVRAQRPRGAIIPMMSVKTNYNAALPELMRGLGGDWNKDYRQWEFFDERRFGDVVRAMRAFYKLDVEARRYTLYVSMDAILEELYSHRNIYLCERQVIRRSEKWARFTAGRDVLFKHASDPERALLIIQNVPAGIYQDAVKQLGDHVVRVDTYQADEAHDGAAPTVGKRAWINALKERAADFYYEEE